MYNYIDEVPQAIQDKIDQMTEDWDWYQEDYFMDANEILDSMIPSGGEYWRDYVKAQAEAEDKMLMFCEDMGIAREDFVAMMHWWNIKSELLAAEYEAQDAGYPCLEALYQEAEQEDDSDYYAEIMNDVIWMNHHC